LIYVTNGIMYCFDYCTSLGLKVMGSYVEFGMKFTIIMNLICPKVDHLSTSLALNIAFASNT